MSPYENRLQLDGFHRIALVTFVRPDGVSLFQSATQSRPEDLRERLLDVGVSNLSIFTKSIGDRTFAFAYFDFKGDDAERAQGAIFSASDWFSSLSRHLSPHPRAKSAERPWLRCELITVVAAVASNASTPVERIGLMSGLKPDCEVSYRTLHQTNWPGVVDCMIQCNYRNWTTFLFELGEELFLFTFFEYTGKDRNADNELMAANPTTQRWWTHTVPCLLELEPGWGPWTSTNRILNID